MRIPVDFAGQVVIHYHVIDTLPAADKVAVHQTDDGTYLASDDEWIFFKHQTEWPDVESKFEDFHRFSGTEIGTVLRDWERLRLSFDISYVRLSADGIETIDGKQKWPGQSFDEAVVLQGSLMKMCREATHIAASVKNDVYAWRGDGIEGVIGTAKISEG